VGKGRKGEWEIGNWGGEGLRLGCKKRGPPIRSGRIRPRGKKKDVITESIRCGEKKNGHKKKKKKNKKKKKKKKQKKKKKKKKKRKKKKKKKKE